MPAPLLPRLSWVVLCCFPEREPIIIDFSFWLAYAFEKRIRQGKDLREGP
jgi:hypothetical protein